MIKNLVQTVVKNQAYYDELGAFLKKGAAFFNPKTGKTLLVPPENSNTLVSLWNGEIKNPLFRGSMSEVIHSLGDAKQIFQIERTGEAIYRKPNALMPFITKANQCSQSEYTKLLMG